MIRVLPFVVVVVIIIIRHYFCPLVSTAVLQRSTKNGSNDNIGIKLELIFILKACTFSDVSKARLRVKERESIIKVVVLPRHY